MENYGLEDGLFGFLKQNVRPYSIINWLVGLYEFKRHCLSRFERQWCHLADRMMGHRR